MSHLLRLSARTLALMVSETALIVGTVALAVWIRLGADEAWLVMTGREELPKALLIALVCQVCLYYADLYDVRNIKDRRELFVRALQALGATSFILAAIYFWFPGVIVGRGVFLLAAVFVMTVIIGWRVVFQWTAKRTGPRERLLLIGTSPAAIELARELHDRREDLGVEICGFIDSDPAAVGTAVFNPGVIGTFENIPAIVRERDVDRVVVSLADARGKLPMEKLLDMKLAGVAFDHLATVYEEYTGKIALENLRPSWLIFSSGFKKTPWLMAAKRATDVLGASIGLVLALPLMLLAALAVKVSSRGPAIYRQQRVGQHGRVFTIYKFRSMRVDAEAKTGAVWATAGGDRRVTPVGGFLRRSRLDELPQLWNVLKGDMSFVGPRPERPEFVGELTRKIPFYGLRHVVRPGATGWAQVRYAYGASVQDALQKLQYDLYYVKNMSLALDLYVIFETAKTVIVRRGS
jgi:sugar transferase (PEP-CTERM system associated)